VFVLGALTGPARACAEDVVPEQEHLEDLDPDSDEVRASIQHRHWQRHWERFNAAGVFVIATAEAAAWSVYLTEPVTEPHWTARLPGDDEIRSALRVTDQQDREGLIIASDGLFGVVLLWPLLVDSFFLAGIVHQDDDAALQMALIDAEVLAIAHMVTWLTSRLAGRVRPEALECAPAGTCGVVGSGPVASFVGGHTIMAYAAAGLTCTHHLENPWLAGQAGGGAACAASLGLATAMSFMRISVDRHWASDIGFGALIGAAIGFGVPYALHYGRAHSSRNGTATEVERALLRFRPGSEGGPLGLTIDGAF
jgi:membrane-associated phospholipid phosphatase